MYLNGIRQKQHLSNIVEARGTSEQHICKVDGTWHLIPLMSLLRTPDPVAAPDPASKHRVDAWRLASRHSHCVRFVSVSLCRCKLKIIIINTFILSNVFVIKFVWSEWNRNFLLDRVGFFLHFNWVYDLFKPQCGGGGLRQPSGVTFSFARYSITSHVQIPTKFPCIPSGLCSTC